MIVTLAMGIARVTFYQKLNSQQSAIAKHSSLIKPESIDTRSNGAFYGVCLYNRNCTRAYGEPNESASMIRGPKPLLCPTNSSVKLAQLHETRLHQRLHHPPRYSCLLSLITDRQCLSLSLLPITPQYCLQAEHHCHQSTHSMSHQH